MPSTAAASEQLDQKRLLKVLTEFRRGNFAVRMPADRTGMPGRIAEVLNDVIERNARLTR